MRREAARLKMGTDLAAASVYGAKIHHGSSVALLVIEWSPYGIHIHLIQLIAIISLGQSIVNWSIGIGLTEQILLGTCDSDANDALSHRCKPGATLRGVGRRLARASRLLVTIAGEQGRSMDEPGMAGPSRQP